MELRQLTLNAHLGWVNYMRACNFFVLWVQFTSPPPQYFQQIDAYGYRYHVLTSVVGGGGPLRCFCPRAPETLVTPLDRRTSNIGLLSGGCSNCDLLSKQRLTATIVAVRRCLLSKSIIMPTLSSLRGDAVSTYCFYYPHVLLVYQSVNW